MSLADNPRAVPGDNQPDHAQIVMDRLASEYAEMQRSVTDALAAARALPEEVDDEDTQSQYASVIKRLRDLNTRLEGVREAEKEPYLRSGNAVDSFFGALKAKLYRKNKNDKAGAADVLQSRVDGYVQRKAAEERARREEEERKARAEEKRIRDEREEQERIQREADQRAERARKAENEDAARAASAVAGEAAARLRTEEDEAQQRRLVASADAVARTADLVRTRTESGHLVTAKQVGFAEIEDSMKLDALTLWPFVSDDAKLKALRSWAQTTQFKKQMPGAIIGMRDKAVIR